MRKRIAASRNHATAAKTEKVREAASNSKEQNEAAEQSLDSHSQATGQHGRV